MRARSTSAIAVALSLAACTDGGGPMTSGTRIESGRDIEGGWFWRPHTLAFTRLAASGASGAEDLWVRELDGASPRLALQDLQWMNAYPWQVGRFGDLLATGDGSFTWAYDLDTHAREGFATGRILVPRPDGRVVADWAQPTLGDDVIRVGPLTVERNISGFLIRAADFMGDDLAMLGHRTQDPAGEQVLARLSPADGSINVLAAGLPAWTSGTSDVLAFGCLPPGQWCAFFQVLGCAADTPACPGTGEIPCAIAFAHDVPGTTAPALLAPAVYDVNRATELPVPAGLSPDRAGYSRSPDGRRVAWADGNMVRVWDACVRRVYGCQSDSGPTIINPGAWRPDSGAVWAFGGQRELLVLSAEDGSCTTPPTAAATDAFFSRDGTRMGWLDQPFSEPGRTLWIGDGLGRNAVAIATGPIVDAFFSDDARFLVIRRLHDSTGEIGVIDLTAPSPAERTVASTTSFTMTLGARRLLTLTHWNSQDQTGQVELFDLARGTSTVLAQPVTALAAAGSVDDAVDIAYVLRTRVPSAFDGLWLATLPPAGAP